MVQLVDIGFNQPFSEYFVNTNEQKTSAEQLKLQIAVLIKGILAERPGRVLLFDCSQVCLNQNKFTLRKSDVN